MSKQGFAMIELIMVIVILGILAAVALPRFHDLRTLARKDKVSAIFGAVRSATAIAHSAYLVAGNDPASVTIEGTDIALTHGYPSATEAGIVAAAGLGAARGGLSIAAAGPGAARGGLSIAADAGAVTVDVIGGTAGRCTMTYTQAASPASPPRIAKVDSAC